MTAPTIELPTILVVDDTPANLSLLANLLKGQYRIKLAKNGLKALELAAESPPDLVLLDIMMPEMDGFEVCRRLKTNELTRFVPVIFLTAKTQIEDEELGFSLGAVDFIHKPISPPIVEARIKAQLEIKSWHDFLRNQNIGLLRQKEIHNQEMDMARSIQQSVLPKPLPKNNSLPVELEAFMRPMREIGGDLYDYFLVGDRQLAIAIGDVCGKGVPASLFMMMSCTSLRSISGLGLSVEMCMTRLNAVLAENNDSCMFITLFFGILDLDTGVLSYCNAGHNPPYLLRANGAMKTLPATGPAAAVFRAAKYQGATITMESDDRLFLFTDGVTEAMSPEGELYGEARLESLLASLRGQTPAVILAGVVAAVDQFADTAEQFDDITCLALTRK